MVMTEQWKMPSRRRVTEDEVIQFTEADAALAGAELRAKAVTFDEVADRLSFILYEDTIIGIPRARIQELSNLAPADMRGLRLWPDGVLLEIPDRDVHLHVPRLLARAIEDITPPAMLRSMFARTGGAATSEKKRLAAIANGKRGGRKPKHAA